MIIHLFIMILKENSINWKLIMCHQLYTFLRIGKKLIKLKGSLMFNRLKCLFCIKLNYRKIYKIFQIKMRSFNKSKKKKHKKNPTLVQVNDNFQVLSSTKFNLKNNDCILVILYLCVFCHEYF